MTTAELETLTTCQFRTPLTQTVQALLQTSAELQGAARQEHEETHAAFLHKIQRIADFQHTLSSILTQAGVQQGEEQLPHKSPG